MQQNLRRSNPPCIPPACPALDLLIVWDPGPAGRLYQRGSNSFPPFSKGRLGEIIKAA